jgi:CBS domain-containing protein
MSNNDLSISPWTPVRDAAAIMRDENVAALSVLVDNVPVGIVTARDFVIRLLPGRHDAGARPVRDAMTANPITCFADQNVVEAAAMMGCEQIRHLLILDRSGNFIGVLSIDDIAEHASEELAGQALGEIVERRSRHT